MAGELESDLFVAQKPVLRVIEGAFAALAAEHPVLLPHPGKFGTVAAKLGDQPAQPAVVEMRSVMRAEFRDHPTRAVLPVTDKGAGSRLKKDEAKQIAVAL